MYPFWIQSVTQQNVEQVKRECVHSEGIVHSMFLSFWGMRETVWAQPLVAGPLESTGQIGSTYLIKRSSFFAMTTK
jgi:hypothetical protein